MTRNRSQSQTPERREVRAGELLAIDSRALIKGPDAFFWLFGPAAPPVKRIGNTAIVYVRGPLEHHDDSFSCNYEEITRNVKCAFEGDEDCEAAERVILAIDSPGGVVSGLYECVDALKKIAGDRKLHAYIEGLCASAAYALACSCSKIYVPSSGIVGSVGVIATMYSQKRRDKMLGLDVVTIVSGARKADGHPHVSISSDAIRAEEKRVAKFAAQFFDLVDESRGFDPEPHEAGLFVGSDAVKAGYADKVQSLSEFIDGQEKKVAQNDTMAQPDTTGDDGMRFTTLIKHTKAAIKSERDPEKKAELRLKLSAYEATRADTKKTYEKETETEETTDEPEEEEEEEEGGNETDRDEDEEPPEEDDDEEESETEDEEEESESDDGEKKALAALGKIKGKAARVIARALKSSIAARKAQRAELKTHRKNSRAIEALREENAKRDRSAVIESALRAGRVTPAEAKKLHKMTTPEIGAFLAARPEPIVRNANLSPNLKASASMLSQQEGNVPPAVVAEITNEMREAAERLVTLSNGKITAKDALAAYEASQKPKEKF